MTRPENVLANDPVYQCVECAETFDVDCGGRCPTCEGKIVDTDEMDRGRLDVTNNSYSEEKTSED